MKRKIIWLIVSCLMVLALVLASCAPAVVEEEVVEEEVEEVVEEAVAPGPEEPQYGGSVTFLITQTATEIFDPAILTRSAETAVMVYERLGVADWAKGPGGTGENPFASTIHAFEFQTGAIAESWEVLDLQTIRYTIREGIHFQDVPPMNGRELTVEDIFYTLDRCTQIPQNMWYGSADDPAYDERDWLVIIDDRTIEVWYAEPSGGIDMVNGVNSWIYIVAQEVVEEYGDLGDWRHQGGTGPFIIEDVVPASSVTLRRNPNYWMHDPLHPENQLPYVDTARGLVIIDESTQLAALRTHKIDRQFIAWDKAQTMKETNPELLNRRVLPSMGYVMFVNVTTEPFSDVRVRQALHLAIDQPTILKDFYKGDAYILVWPVMPNWVSEYTPLEELPDNLRELFEYHPDKARELLAEAGYPDGFKTEVAVTATWQRGIDIMTIVREHLAEVGVDMDINVMESSAFGSSLYARTIGPMSYITWANNGLWDALGWASGGWAARNAETDELLAISIYNFGGVVDPVAEEALTLVGATVDPVERSRIAKEENLRQMELCWEIQLPAPAGYLFWTPWMKGYHGEVGMGPDPPEVNGVYQFIWIDQDLKYEMTGIRGIIK